MWSFVLTRKDHTRVGEITNAFEREAKWGLSRGDTAGFKVRVDHPLLENIYGEDTMLQVWQGQMLRFWGDVTTAQFSSTEDGSPPLVACTAAGPFWRLTRRLAGLSSLTEGDHITTKSKARIAAQLLENQHALANGETGIKLNATSYYDAAGAIGDYTTGPYKKVSDAFNELANGFDGFEWRMEALDEAGEKIALFEAENNYGATRLDTVFEYGVGQTNVRSLTYLRDITNLTNFSVMMPENVESETAVSAEDAVSRASHGLFMELIEGVGVIDKTLRQQIVQEAVNVKGRPRFVAGMTLDFADDAGRVPTIHEDFWLGDIVQARAESYGVRLFSGLARIYGIELRVDNNGQEAVTPILVDEGTEE